MQQNLLSCDMKSCAKPVNRAIMRKSYFEF